MWDVSDLKDDVVEHVQVIKKTVSGTLRPKPADTESTPLLNPASEEHKDDFTVQVLIELWMSFKITCNVLLNEH